MRTRSFYINNFRDEEEEVYDDANGHRCRSLLFGDDDDVDGDD
jgi:hypothetical protein